MSQAVAEILDGFESVHRIERLDRGFSWVTLGVDDVIVRVAPPGGTLDPYDPEAEAANAARREISAEVVSSLGSEPVTTDLLGRAIIRQAGGLSPLPGRAVLRSDRPGVQVGPLIGTTGLGGLVMALALQPFQPRRLTSPADDRRQCWL